MKLTCTQENLKRAINYLERVVSKQNTLPILSNILFETEKSGLKMSATNLEIGIVSKISAKIEREGKITIPAKVIGSFISNLNSDERIELEMKEDNLKIESGHAKAVIKGLSPQEFPLIPQATSQAQLKVSGKALKGAITRVISSVAINDARQELTGVNCLFGEKTLIFATTDSFRLAEAKLPLLERNVISEIYEPLRSKQAGVIIPASALNELIRVIDTDENHEVEIIIEEGQIFFNVDGIKLVSRLINGKYPEYQHIIPKNFSTQVLVEKEALQNAIKMTGAFSYGRVSEVRFETEERKQTLKVNGQSVEAGEGNAELGAEIKGIDQKLVFNAKYILDGLSHIYTSRVALMINSGTSPLIIKGVNEGSEAILEDFLFIAMPINN